MSQVSQLSTETGQRVSPVFSLHLCGGQPAPLSVSYLVPLDQVSLGQRDHESERKSSTEGLSLPRPQCSLFCSVIQED